MENVFAKDPAESPSSTVERTVQVSDTRIVTWSRQRRTCHTRTTDEFHLCLIGVCVALHDL